MELLLSSERASASLHMRLRTEWIAIWSWVSDGRAAAAAGGAEVAGRGPVARRALAVVLAFFAASALF